MYNIISNYVNSMNKNDITLFANKNNIKLSNSELDFIYSFIKNNYNTILKNPSSFDISIYKDKFSKENYIFLSNLVNKYKRMII